MPHPSRALPARSLLLWTIAVAGAGLTGFVTTTEPTASATPHASGAVSSDPASWPRFALHEARLAAAQLDHAHRRVQALEQIAAATTGLGDCTAARTILAEAFGTAREIADVALRDLALRDIAKRQAACADMAGALAALPEIVSPGERDAVSIAVVSAQIAAGELPQALEIAGRIPDFLVRAMASADIAALHADIGNAQALNTARLIARATPNARQRDVALSYVASIQAQSGDVHSALGTSAAIKDGTSKAYALARIAAARAGTADDPAVRELLDRAFSTARRARPTGATAAVLCEIAQGYLVRGDVAQARSALDHAYTVATSKRGLRYGAGAVEKIARLRARTGDIAGALAIAEGIPDGSSRALLVHDILAVQAEKDDVTGALRAANALTDVQLQVAALFGIVGVQMTSGDSAGARTSLQRVLELARETQDLGFRSHSLGAVAAAQVALGDRSDAWPNFQDALAAAAALPDAYARAYAYVNLSDPFTQRP
jgi:tetratricopeptide (TPR) repeat protein